MTDTILEVCCGDLGSVAAAAEGGAGRVELCVGLGEGGFTPSVAMVEAAMRHNIKVNVLVRARSGDFLYSDDEKAMPYGCERGGMRSLAGRRKYRH